MTVPTGDVPAGSYIRQLYGLLDDAAMLFRHAEERGRFLADESHAIERWRGRYRDITKVAPADTHERDADKPAQQTAARLANAPSADTYPTGSDRDLNDMMAVAYEQGREDEKATVGKPRTVFVCDRCGFLSYGRPEIEPGDGNAEEPPGLDVDCGCYMGPRWVKGVWRQLPRSSASQGPGGYVEGSSDAGQD